MNIDKSQIPVLVFLGISAVYDLRKKEIILWLTAVFAAAGVVFRFLQGTSLFFVLTGLIPGGVMAAVSLLSRGRAGFGDAILLAAFGVWTGGRTAFLTLVIALGIQAAVSVVYRLSGGREKELPFVPAICAAYVLLL